MPGTAAEAAEGKNLTICIVFSKNIFRKIACFVESNCQHAVCLPPLLGMPKSGHTRSTPCAQSWEWGGARAEQLRNCVMNEQVKGCVDGQMEDGWQRGNGGMREEGGMEGWKDGERDGGRGHSNGQVALAQNDLH